MLEDQVWLLQLIDIDIDITTCAILTTTTSE